VEKVIADNLAEDEIDCGNLRYSRSRPGLAAPTAAKDNIIREVVGVGES
jgi:hypothetical protein